MRTVVTEAELAAAASLFPPVAEHCVMCNGEGKLVVGMNMSTDPPTPRHHRCGPCGGQGHILRPMEAREEHHFLMILLQEKADAT